MKQIRNAVGDGIILRIDANQGWDFETSLNVLKEIEKYNIQFCEQPMRTWNDEKLPVLKKNSPVKIMADESVFVSSRCNEIDKSERLRLYKHKICKVGRYTGSKKNKFHL